MKYLLICSCLLVALWSKAQFQVNGNAYASSDSCFVITPDQQGQSGNIWTLEKINLRDPFDFRFRMYFGDKDANGADGFVFALQPLSNTIGGTGGGLGFAGIAPSFGVEFDTYQNSADYNDPVADHMAILRNGNVSHWSGGGTLSGPTPISPTSIDVEDNAFHWVRFRWHPDSTLFEVFYDCERRLSYNSDIINTIFNGDSMVYWGVTGGTGLYHNRQEVCLIDLGVDEFTLQEQPRCTEDSITLQADKSKVYTYTWTPNYHLLDATSSHPTVFPDTTTTYYVEIKDECENTLYDSVTIFVPHHYDTLPDTSLCDGATLLLQTPYLEDASYSWNDIPGDTSILVSEAGTYILSITEYQCIRLDTIEVVADACKEILIPNIFTPNNDGFNDFFDLTTLIGDEKNWNLKVYNRWGKPVYEQLSYDHTWNGKGLSDGLYFYEIGLLSENPHSGWVQIRR